MKLIDFSVATGPTSEEAEHCRKMSFSVALEDTKGRVVRRDSESLVFEGVLSDPDQVPWLIASCLRDLLCESDIVTLNPRR